MCNNWNPSPTLNWNVKSGIYPSRSQEPTEIPISHLFLFLTLEPYYYSPWSPTLPLVCITTMVKTPSVAARRGLQTNAGPGHTKVGLHQSTSHVSCWLLCLPTDCTKSGLWATTESRRNIEVRRRNATGLEQRVSVQDRNCWGKSYMEIIEWHLIESCLESRLRNDTFKPARDRKAIGLNELTRPSHVCIYPHPSHCAACWPYSITLTVSPEKQESEPVSRPWQCNNIYGLSTKSKVSWLPHSTLSLTKCMLIFFLLSHYAGQESNTSIRRIWFSVWKHIRSHSLYLFCRHAACSRGISLSETPETSTLAAERL